MPHGRHIYAKGSDMVKSTMCAYTHSYHALPHWKYDMQCCAKFPSVNLPDQETDYLYTDTFISICFLVYHIIILCSTHGSLPLNEKKDCCKCKQDYASEQSTKYTLEKS